MSQENVEAGSTGDRVTPLPPEGVEWLREGYAVWNEGGPSAMVAEVWHPDIAWHDPPDLVDATVQRGATAVAEHLTLRLEVLGHISVTLQNAWRVREHDMVLVELSLHSGGVSSGVKLDVPIFHVLRLRDGRIIEVWEYMRRHQALEAVGLRE